MSSYDQSPRSSRGAFVLKASNVMALIMTAIAALGNIWFGFVSLPYEISRGTSTATSLIIGIFNIVVAGLCIAFFTLNVMKIAHDNRHWLMREYDRQ